MKHSVTLILILSLLLTVSSCMPSEEPASSVCVQDSIPPASADDINPSDTTTPVTNGSDITNGAEELKFEPKFVFPEDWTVIECLNEEPNLLFDYNMIGESEDAFFLGVFNRDKEDVKHILDVRKVSKSNFTLMSKRIFAGERYPTIYNTGSSFIIQGEKQAEVYDYNLELRSTIAVPDEIQAEMVWEYSDEKQMYLRYFAGYAVTADGSKFYYSNEKGLFEFDTASRKQTLLLEAPLVKSEISRHYIIPGNLQLRAGEQVLFFTRPAYEGLKDAGYVKLSDGSITFLPVYQYSDKILDYSPHYLDIKSDKEGMTLCNFNLVTGETSNLMNIPYDEYRGINNPFNNDRYCSFAVYTNGKISFYRYDTETKLTELVCKDTEVQITSDSDGSGGQSLNYSNLIGILSDGRMLLHFFQDDVHALVLTGG